MHIVFFFDHSSFTYIASGLLSWEDRIFHSIKTNPYVEPHTDRFQLISFHFFLAKQNGIFPILNEKFWFMIFFCKN